MVRTNRFRLVDPFWKLTSFQTKADRIVRYATRFLRKHLFSLVLATLIMPFCSQLAFSQVWHKINISAGAGFSSPVQSAGQSMNTGWSLDFRGGYDVTRHLDADLDFNYNHFGLTSSALAHFGEPGGSVSVWSLTFQPEYRVLPRRNAFNAYPTGGFGIYDRNLTLTSPTGLTTIICDPFFGCYPVSYGANQIVASFSTVKPGFNTGAGVEFRLLDSRAGLFARGAISENVHDAWERSELCAGDIRHALGNVLY